MVVIETERLYLREFLKDDVEKLFPIFSDPETMSYYPSPLNFKQTEMWIERNQERYKKDGIGLWAVCLKETDELIGDCGLVKQMVDGREEVEIGYHINKKFWFKGIATEAALACKEYGFQSLRYDKLISIIDPKNTASIRVAEKIGFTKAREWFIFNKNHSIYSGYRHSSRN